MILTSTQDFWTKLKKHLLARIKAKQANVEVSSSTLSIANLDEANSAMELDSLFFKKECMYQHNIIRINYTTYDVRRAQDVINPNTDHRDVILLSAADPDQPHHQYVYARVLGIYHANIIYTASEVPDYRPQRMEFLWVRWFTNTQNEPVQRSWRKRQLDCLQLLPVNHEDAFGFLDPGNVLRGVHLVPRFAKGRCHPDGRGISECARDSNDWNQYYACR